MEGVLVFGTGIRPQLHFLSSCSTAVAATSLMLTGYERDVCDGRRLAHLVIARCQLVRPLVCRRQFCRGICSFHFLCRQLLPAEKHPYMCWIMALRSDRLSSAVSCHTHDFAPNFVGTRDCTLGLQPPPAGPHVLPEAVVARLPPALRPLQSVTRQQRPWLKTQRHWLIHEARFGEDAKSQQLTQQPNPTNARHYPTLDITPCLSEHHNVISGRLPMTSGRALPGKSNAPPVVSGSMQLT